jgi:hypothetical protein
MKLTIIRFLKLTFIRLRLHNVFSLFTPFFQQMIWMTRLSKWADKNKNISYNDFPSTWDYKKRFGLYNFIIEKEGLDTAINYLEFGVASGASFEWWMTKNSHPDSRFYGFDTFTGLPEDFGPYKKGAFSNGISLPDIKDNRGIFYQGLFQQTLPGFLQKFDNNKRTVLMLDADLYTATLFTLSSMATHLKPGDIILFDEFGVPTHEFMAYSNFMDSHYFEMELIGAASNYYFTAFKVKRALVS